MAKQEKTAAELYREERKARLAKAAKQNSKKAHNVSVSSKTTKAVTAIIALVVVVAIAFSVVSATGILERKKVAFKSGDSSVSMAEYSYYYNAAYTEIVNAVYSIEQQMPGYGAQFYGFDMYTMPDEQQYTMGEIEGVENPTWSDYFDNTAKEHIEYSRIALNYAKENNIVLDEEDMAEVDSSISTWETQAAQGNYSLTAYLQANYGKCMSADIFRQILENQALVQKVQDTKNEEIKATFTDKEVEKAYNEALSTYGAVSYRSYEFAAETVTSTDEEGSETSAVTEETMAEAKAEAEAFAAKITDEKSFKQAAADAEKAKENDDYEEYLTDDSLTLNEEATSADIVVTDEKAGEWFFSKETKAGDVFVAEETDTGYIVLYMVDPVHKAPDAVETYDVRHILVKFPEEEKTQTDDEEETEAKALDVKAYEDAVIVNDYEEEVTDIASFNKAVDILTEYLDGERTADAFGALAKKYTEDTNGEQGGLYEDVAMGQMVSEFEGWSSDLSRKEGDVGIVETTYGYHIMYFVSAEISNTDDEIKNDLAAEDLNAFVEELSETEGYEIADINEEVVSEARKNMLKVIEQNIAYFNSYSSYGY